MHTAQLIPLTGRQSKSENCQKPPTFFYEISEFRSNFISAPAREHLVLLSERLERRQDSILPHNLRSIVITSALQLLRREGRQVEHQEHAVRQHPDGEGKFGLLRRGAAGAGI